MLAMMSVGRSWLAFERSIGVVVVLASSMRRRFATEEDDDAADIVTFVRGVEYPAMYVDYMFVVSSFVQSNGIDICKTKMQLPLRIK